MPVTSTLEMMEHERLPVSHPRQKRRERERERETERGGEKGRKRQAFRSVRKPLSRDCREEQ